MKDVTLPIGALREQLRRCDVVYVGGNGHSRFLCPQCGGEVVALEHEDGGTSLTCSGCELDRLADLLAFKDPGAQPVPFKPLTARQANLDMVKPFRWLWQDRIVMGYLNLLVGDEGIGKGTFLAWLIARITRGELPGDLRGKPARVLVVGDEDGFGNVWVPRLVAAGADLNHVLELPTTDDGPLDLNRQALALRHLIDAERIAAVVYDQLLDNLGVGVDNWRDKQVRESLQPVRHVAAETDTVHLGALHTNKVRNGSFREKVSGTQAFNALSRSSLLLAEHPDDVDKRVLVRGKGNYARRPAAIEFSIEGKVLHIGGHRLEVGAVAGVGESTVTVDQALKVESEPQTKAALGREILQEELADGEWRQRQEIVQALAEVEIGEREARRLAKTLGVETKRSDGFPSTTLWRLARGNGLTSPTSRTSRTDSPATAATPASSASADRVDEAELERQRSLVEGDA